MKCIIIEDQPPAQRILKKYLEDYGSIELIGTFSDAIQALDFLKSNDVDLIFLDIHLPKLSGIDFLKSLQNPPPVILTTAFPDYALESYELNVVDYLLKPFSFSRFIKAIGKINIKDNPESPATSKDESIFIKSGYDHIKVKLEEILFIKADNDYTEIVLQDRKHLSPESLKYWLEYFGKDRMIRVHKSYIVHIPHIIKVSSASLDIGYREAIPIGRAYKEEVTKMLLSKDNG